MKGPNSAGAPADPPAGGDFAGRPGHGRRRVLSWPILFGLACILLFLGGFALFSTHVAGLAAPTRLAGADGIIVLTGGQSRIDVALELLKLGKGKRLLISGVHPSANRDAISAATGADPRLFTCCVDIDHAALDTIGNAEESAKWIRSHDFERVILVTSNYHMPRSLLEMRRLLGGSTLEPYPVTNSRLDGGGWMADPDALRVLFTEYNKYLLALARGVVPLSPRRDSFGVAKATAADN